MSSFAHRSQDRIEPRVVHGHAHALGVLQGQAQVLEDLQAPRAVLNVARELRRRLLAPARRVDARVVEVGEDHEAPGVAAGKVAVPGLELGSLPSAQIHHDPHVKAVHVGDQLRGVRRGDVGVLVVVDVDEPVLGEGRMVLGHHQRRLGFVLLDRQGLGGNAAGAARAARTRDAARASVEIPSASPYETGDPEVYAPERTATPTSVSRATSTGGRPCQRTSSTMRAASGSR